MVQLILVWLTGSIQFLDIFAHP